MRFETLSVREAREQLPRLLARFRGGDRSVVGVGSHRKTEAVVVPVEVYDELVAVRTQTVTDAAASLRAEGLASSEGADAIAERWARGEISTEQLRLQIRGLHGLS